MIKLKAPRSTDKRPSGMIVLSDRAFAFALSCLGHLPCAEEGRHCRVQGELLGGASASPVCVSGSPRLSWRAPAAAGSAPSLLFSTSHHPVGLLGAAAAGPLGNGSLDAHSGTTWELQSWLPDPWLPHQPFSSISQVLLIVL